MSIFRVSKFSTYGKLSHRNISDLLAGARIEPSQYKEDDMDFLHQQVLTARNVEGNPVADFWYGGLNYQIEHHLFPNMPRNNLKKAQVVVKSFCEEKGIPYHQTGVWQSHVEILSFLHEVSAPLRQKKA